MEAGIGGFYNFYDRVFSTHRQWMVTFFENRACAVNFYFWPVLKWTRGPLAPSTSVPRLSDAGRRLVLPLAVKQVSPGSHARSVYEQARVSDHRKANGAYENAARRCLPRARTKHAAVLASFDCLLLTQLAEINYKKIDNSSGN